MSFDVQFSDPSPGFEVQFSAGIQIVGTSDHKQLANRDAADQHPMIAITGLVEALDFAGKPDPEVIAEAVKKYMDEHPVPVDESDPTVPDWAKQPEKPKYTAGDVGALPAGTKIPSKTSDLTNDSGFITGFTETDPTVPNWAKQEDKPTYTADEVGADPAGSASTALKSAQEYTDKQIFDHNVDPDAHNDIRLLVVGLSQRINALADSDDTTLDQMSELVAYIKDNRELIETITTAKINVSDIIDNLTTNVPDRPISAAQGVVLKQLVDDLTTAVGGKLDASALTDAVNTALAQAKESGEFDGAPGAKGEPGYTPQKYVDYWTESDKQEMVSDTVDALPVYEGESEGEESDVNVDLSNYYTKEESDEKYQPKGEYLTEHQPIKTINGQSLVGEGDIEFDGGVSSWNDLTDRPFGEEIGRVEVLAETVVREVPKMGHTADANFGSLGLEVGKRYTVTIDGVDYEFEAWGANAGTISIVGIGSGDGVGFPSGDGDLGWGEFGAADIHTGANEVCILEIARYGGITENECIDRIISIATEGTIIRPIDGKYLPKGAPWIEENGVLMGEATATSITHPTFGKMWAVYGGTPKLTAGETYTITYNGADYKCVCQVAPSGLVADPDAVAMGNFVPVGGPNTGEPFAMLISYALQEVDIIDMVGSSSVEVKISGLVVHKLDPRCLPEESIRSNHYTKDEIDAIMGSYVNEINTLLGGDS